MGQTPQRGARPQPGGCQGGQSLLLADAGQDRTASRQAPRVTGPDAPGPQAPSWEQQPQGPPAAKAPAASHTQEPGGPATGTGFRDLHFILFSVRIMWSRALHWREVCTPRAGDTFEALILGCSGLCGCKLIHRVDQLSLTSPLLGHGPAPSQTSARIRLISGNKQGPG